MMGSRAEVIWFEVLGLMIRTRKELVELAGSCSFMLGLSNSCNESGIFSSTANLRLSNLRLSLYTIVDIVSRFGLARPEVKKLEVAKTRKRPHRIIPSELRR